MDEVIYFSVNNWFCGENYPDTPNFRKWMGNDLALTFEDDKWAKENKLCIYYGMIDMSTNFTVSAPREWVEKNCPELLTDKEYTYTKRRGRYKKKLFGEPELVWEDVVEKKKYSDFVYVPEDGEESPWSDRFDMPFKDYCEENFGSTYYETGWWESDEEEYGDDEE